MTRWQPRPTSKLGKANRTPRKQSRSRNKRRVLRRFRHQKKNPSTEIRDLPSKTLFGRYSHVIYLMRELPDGAVEAAITTLRMNSPGGCKVVVRRKFRYGYGTGSIREIRLRDEADVFLLRLCHSEIIWKIKRVVAPASGGESEIAPPPVAD